MKWLVSLYLLLRVFILVAQEWSAPINVASQSGSCGDVDFFVSIAGTIHCVWVNGDEPYSATYIYYSRSVDNGQNWSVPVNISGNTENRMLYPRIVADINDNVYVVFTCEYASENSNLKFRSNENGIWGSIFDLAPNHVLASFRDLVIDNDGKVYAIWYWGGSNGSTYYRYLLNGSWSNILLPYQPDSNRYLISDCVIDEDNNLHCVGSVRYPGDSIYSVSRVAYFYFNAQTELWAPPVDFGYTYCYYTTIDLDSAENPRIIWREETLQGPIGIFYTYFNGLNWSQPLMIMNNNGQFQRVQVDSVNIAHLVQAETVGEGTNRMYRLSYYTSDDWTSLVIVPPDYSLGLHNLQYEHNALYLMYSSSGSDNLGYVWLKIKPLTPVENNDPATSSTQLTPDLIRAYPNPFKGIIRIDVKSNRLINQELTLYNCKGQIIRKLQPSDTDFDCVSFRWDGLDKNNNPVSSGAYLCKIQISGTYYTKLFYRIK